MSRRYGKGLQLGLARYRMPRCNVVFTFYVYLDARSIRAKLGRETKKRLRGAGLISSGILVI